MNGREFDEDDTDSLHWIAEWVGDSATRLEAMGGDTTLTDALDELDALRLVLGGAHAHVVAMRNGLVAPFAEWEREHNAWKADEARHRVRRTGGVA